MFKKTGFHHRHVGLLFFVQLLTWALPLLRLCLFLLLSAGHCFLFFFLAAGDTCLPGSSTCFSRNFLFFEKERALNASVINCEKSTEYTHLSVETRLRLSNIFRYDSNANTRFTLKQQVNEWSGSRFPSTARCASYLMPAGNGGAHLDRTICSKEQRLATD